MGRPNVRLQLTSIIKGKYIACRKLGEGGCGVIYEVALIESPHRRFACKAEDQDSGRDEEILKMEAKVMKKINQTKSIHCPLWIEGGKFENYNYLIMTLLGPSVSDLRKAIPSQKFTLFTVIVIGVQALDALREVHNAGFVHRDIKPSNYAIGDTGTPKEKLIYILDFGLARAYRVQTPEGKWILRNPRRTAQFRGTTRYCSINAHDREEQGRHDDLWSLFYMLVEMIIGNLPWKNMTDHATAEREKTDKEQELLDQSPKEFELYLTHVKQLGYGITPDYELLRNIFLNVFKRNKFDFSMKLDWEKDGKYGNLYSWNRCSLPRVTSKDSTVFTLEQLLKMPKNLVEVTEDMALKTQEREWYATISSHDDTLEEEAEKTIEPEVQLPSLAMDSSPRKKSYENRKKEQLATPKYTPPKQEQKMDAPKLVTPKYTPPKSQEQKPNVPKTPEKKTAVIPLYIPGFQTAVIQKSPVQKKRSTIEEKSREKKADAGKHSPSKVQQKQVQGFFFSG
ncbi:unnamed protein product [Cylicocyclus nassatus]|uniref:Protein kinase domain-containing protein n=1 Tax=Cylicocyclus nassatus TaxID=53992 RepID=A0AA36GL06_CYLNA|nr:unnamed protein product [Cylicocyclus nassatus]